MLKVVKSVMVQFQSKRVSLNRGLSVRLVVMSGQVAPVIMGAGGVEGSCCAVARAVLVRERSGRR